MKVVLKSNYSREFLSKIEKCNGLNLFFFISTKENLKKYIKKQFRLNLAPVVFQELSRSQLKVLMKTFLFRLNMDFYKAEIISDAALCGKNRTICAEKNGNQVFRFISENFFREEDVL